MKKHNRDWTNEFVRGDGRKTHIHMKFFEKVMKGHIGSVINNIVYSTFTSEI